MFKKNKIPVMPNIITVKKKGKKYLYYLFPSVEFKISFFIKDCTKMFSFMLRYLYYSKHFSN